MNLKTRIWMLPVLAASIFGLGIATVLVFSTRTSDAITTLGASDYPFLDSTNQFASHLDSLGETLQGAVAEGDGRRLDEADERARAMRSVIKTMAAIPGKSNEGKQLDLLFDAYFRDAKQATQLLLGSTKGDSAAAVATMQTSQAALTTALKSLRDQARANFDAGLVRSKGGVAASLYATLASAAAVIACLGTGSYLLIGGIWRQLGGEPGYARDMMRRIAGGDLALDISVHAGADNSLLSAMREMTSGLSALVTEVRGGSTRMRLAAQEIASGNHDLSQRTEMQAASLERTSARINDLAETVQANTDSANQASELANSASSIAMKGGEVVTRVIDTMSDINASSKRIFDIVGVIDGIAFQTNILALNAAVEAARAGEQGRGFAVVAGEVRTLARRSAEAAKEIKSLIGESVTRIETGSRLVLDAGSTMDEIVRSVAGVATIIGEISLAAVEQNRGISAVNGDMTQLDDMTQRNAALVEQAAAAASSMEQQSAGLESAVAVFRLANTDPA